MRDVQPSFWSGKRVLLTGHTGFKGGWLALWLDDLGATVGGFALAPPTSPNLFDAAGLSELVADVRGDVRDPTSLGRTITEFAPDVVFHLAAQPLVRQSYALPVETYATNVMGTVHLLEAARSCASVRVVVNVTTDKVYDNREWAWGYRESDPLGGHDPYSSSKACSEIVTSAYARSFLLDRGFAVATARAGNVVGGGDWSKDRLVPDAAVALSCGEPVVIRNPHAIRPWQHVVEPLRGYLMLVEACWAEPSTFSRAFNFGPAPEDMVPVGRLMDMLCRHWPDARWENVSEAGAPHEATFLKLDTALARSLLAWTPRLSLDRALSLTAEWYRAFYARATPEELRELMRAHIRCVSPPDPTVDGRR
jgi:CDP-glucose 4,6-dehydratase